jgi:hypothetical protein
MSTHAVEVSHAFIQSLQLRYTHIRKGISTRIRIRIRIRIRKGIYVYTFIQSLQLHYIAAEDTYKQAAEDTYKDCTRLHTVPSTPLYTHTY